VSLALATKGVIAGLQTGDAGDIYVTGVEAAVDIETLEIGVEVGHPAVIVDVAEPGISVSVEVDEGVAVAVDDEDVGVEI
jgi:hypothetical protein